MSDRRDEPQLLFDALFGEADNDGEQSRAREALSTDAEGAEALAREARFVDHMRAALPGALVEVSPDEHEDIMRAVTGAHIDLLQEVPGEISGEGPAVSDALHQSVIDFARANVPEATAPDLAERSSSAERRLPAERDAGASPFRRSAWRGAGRWAALAAAVAAVTAAWMLSRPIEPEQVSPAMAPTSVQIAAARGEKAASPTPSTPAAARAPELAEAASPAPGRARTPAPSAPEEAPAPVAEPDAALAARPPELPRSPGSLVLEHVEGAPRDLDGTAPSELVAHTDGLRPRDTALERAPGDPVALFDSLPGLADAGHHDQVLTATEFLLAPQVLPTQHRPVVLYLRGQALEALGRVAEARQVYETLRREHEEFEPDVVDGALERLP